MVGRLSGSPELRPVTARPNIFPIRQIRDDVKHVIVRGKRRILRK